MVSRPIPGFPNYAATESGGILNVRTGRIRKPQKVGLGYRAVQIGGRYEYVHRLVALAFHGEPPTPQHEVAHLDGVRSNNVPSNVKWKTRAENHDDKRRHGTMGWGERAYGAVLTADDVRVIRREYRPYNNCGALAERFGVQGRQIRRIVARERWAHIQ